MKMLDDFRDFANAAKVMHDQFEAIDDFLSYGRVFRKLGSNEFDIINDAQKMLQDTRMYLQSSAAKELVKMLGDYRNGQ